MNRIFWLFVVYSSSISIDIFFLYLFECYNMIVNVVVLLLLFTIIIYIMFMAKNIEMRKKTEISNSLKRKKNLKKTLWVCIIHFQQTHKLIEYKRKKSVRDIFITMCFGTRRINKKKKKWKTVKPDCKDEGTQMGKSLFVLFCYIWRTLKPNSY